MPNSFRASGISCQPTLFVDPVLCVAAPMAGARQDHQLLMPFVSHREKYIISPYIDWLSFFFNRSWRKPMDGIASLMIKLADVEQFVALVNDSLYSLLKYPETCITARCASSVMSMPSPSIRSRPTTVMPSSRPCNSAIQASASPVTCGAASAWPTA